MKHTAPSTRRRSRWLTIPALLVIVMTALWLGWQIWPADAEGVDRETRYVDMHVHVAGIGAGGSGCFVHPMMRENFRFPFFLRAMDTTVEELEAEGDAVAVRKLSERVAASRRVEQAVILALDGVVDADGRLDRDRTIVYVPNEYVAEQADRHHNLLFGASINPYRHDALERLREAHARGAVLVKWIPAIMHIDPADPRIEPFYRLMVELDLPLLSHAGQERSFPGALDHFSDPRKLTLPLELGVTVIAAHVGTTGEYEGESSFERILPMFGEYPNLYSEISSLTQINKLGYLARTVDRVDLHERLLYGSDWPLQFYPLVHPLYQWPRMSLGKARAITDLANPWDRDVAIKQAAGVPEAIFERSRELLLDPRASTR